MHELFAWIGEDELGSGQVGIKIGIREDGTDTALVAMAHDRHKLERLASGLQQQANRYGKTIRLARFVFAEDVMTVSPQE